MRTFVSLFVGLAVANLVFATVDRIQGDDADAAFFILLAIFWMLVALFAKEP